MTGDELRALRARAQLTQAALGALLGLTGPAAQVSIARWESGARPISPVTATALRAVLDKCSNVG